MRQLSATYYLFATFMCVTLLYPLTLVMAVDVTQQQQKLKGAVEKAKKTVEAIKEVPKTISDVIPSGSATADQDKKKKTEAVDYVYLGKRDPFLPLIKQETEKKKAGSPIENFMVADIKVVGILQKNAQYIAQIVLPDGKTYTIRPGQKLGLMGGIVSEINKDAVVVKEKGLDADGKPTVKTIQLRLRKEEED